MGTKDGIFLIRWPMIGQFYRARGYVLETFNLKLAGDKNCFFLPSYSEQVWNLCILLAY